MPGPDNEPRYRVLGVMPREIEVRTKQEPEDTVFTWPHFLVRHAVVAAVTVVVVFAISIAFDAPLQEMANPNLTPPVAKAPWYFAGLQELLAHAHPMVAGVLAPAAAIVFLFALPFLDRGRGWRIRDRKLSAILFTALLLVAVVLTVVGAFFRGPGWSWVPPWDTLYLEL